MHRITTVAMLPAAALALAACSGSDSPTTDAGPAATLTTAGGDDTRTDDSGSEDSTPDDSAVSGEAEDDALRGTPADLGGPYGELRDGVWAVGPAGSVEFRVTGSDTLELVGAEANEGWQLGEREIESDEIDTDFRRGPVDFTFEAEIDEGVLEIEIDQDIDPAEGGTFAVGEAATVQVTVDNGRLVLGDVSLNDGWTEVKRETDDDEVELDARRDGDGFFEQWELQADLDDGALTIEVDYEIEGRFAG